MELLIILLGVFVIIAGLLKHVTNLTFGYQLVNVPGIITACLGILIVVLGVVWG